MFHLIERQADVRFPRKSILFPCYVKELSIHVHCVCLAESINKWVERMAVRGGWRPLSGLICEIVNSGVVLGGYLTYKKPNKPSKATKSQKNFCSRFPEPIIERIKTELWQDLGVLSTLGWKKLYQSNTRNVDSLSVPSSTNNQSHALFIPEPFILLLLNLSSSESIVKLT